MEILDQNFNQQEPQSNNEIQFHGDGARYFGIVALNVFFTIVSLGLYYPWAKTTYRKYLWSQLELNDSRFTFNGTGKEVFLGILKLIAIVIGFVLAYSLVSFVLMKILGLSFSVVMSPSIGLILGIFATQLIFLSFFLILFGFAIYGSYRYRISRTSWRGIYFGFDGNVKEFVKLFIIHGLLTLFTFGIYSSWMRVKVMKYLFSHTTLGDNRFDFHGDGGNLFGINLVGFLLMLPTLFMYFPIFIKNRFNFTLNNLTIENGEKRRAFQSKLENKEAWTTLMLNLILLLFTLGLAFPWVLMRTMRLYFNNISIPSEFDFDELTQADTAFNDASGDELGDFLDIGLDF